MSDYLESEMDSADSGTEIDAGPVSDEVLMHVENLMPDEIDTRQTGQPDNLEILDAGEPERALIEQIEFPDGELHGSETNLHSSGAGSTIQSAESVDTGPPAVGFYEETSMV